MHIVLVGEREEVSSLDEYPIESEPIKKLVARILYFLPSLPHQNTQKT
jgi:hypothetical protein